MDTHNRTDTYLRTLIQQNDRTLSSPFFVKHALTHAHTFFFFFFLGFSLPSPTSFFLCFLDDADFLLFFRFSRLLLLRFSLARFRLSVRDFDPDRFFFFFFFLSLLLFLLPFFRFLLFLFLSWVLRPSSLVLLRVGSYHPVLFVQFGPCSACKIAICSESRIALNKLPPRSLKHACGAKRRHRCWVLSECGSSSFFAFFELFSCA